jgi:hypothetical protein
LREADFTFCFCDWRQSQQYLEGMTITHGEYQKEVEARKALESEVTRLKVQLSG